MIVVNYRAAFRKTSLASSEMQTPPFSRTASNARLRKPRGNWTVPPTPCNEIHSECFNALRLNWPHYRIFQATSFLRTWTDSAKNPASPSFGIECLMTSLNCSMYISSARHCPAAQSQLRDVYIIQICFLIGKVFWRKTLKFAIQTWTGESLQFFPPQGPRYTSGFMA